MSPEQSEFLDHLFHQHARGLRRYAMSYLKDSARAEEVVQDTFHVAVVRVEALMEHEAPEGWLKKTAKNKILKSEEARRRYAYHVLSLDTELQSEPPCPEDTWERPMEGEPTAEEKIRQALTENERYLLGRIVLGKATHKEMAQELGITVWDSQKRLQRIREKLYHVFPERKQYKK